MKTINQMVIYNGARAIVKAISKRTASVSIQLLDDCRPYKVGDNLCVNNWELKEYSKNNQ